MIERIRRFIEDWLYSLALLLLTLASAFALAQNGNQNDRLEELVRDNQDQIAITRYYECVAQRDARDSMLRLIINIEPLLPADRLDALRLDLPEIQCSANPALRQQQQHLVINKESPMSNWSPAELAGLIGAIIPVLTALATRFEAAAKLKAGIALALAFITGPVLVFIQSNESIISKLTAKSSLIAFGVAIVTYLGVYGPIVNLDARKIMLPSKGLGAPKS